MKITKKSRHMKEGATPLKTGAKIGKARVTNKVRTWKAKKI